MGPAQFDQVAGIVELHGPTCDVALAILHVQKDLRMRVLPHELCHGPLQGLSWDTVVVARRSVVCPCSGADHSKADEEGKRRCPLGVGSAGVPAWARSRSRQ